MLTGTEKNVVLCQSVTHEYQPIFVLFLSIYYSRFKYLSSFADGVQGGMLEVRDFKKKAKEGEEVSLTMSL